MPKREEKPKHAAPPRGQTRAEKANAKAKETGDKAKFGASARKAADDYQAEQDRLQEERRKHR